MFFSENKIAPKWQFLELFEEISGIFLLFVTEKMTILKFTYIFEMRYGNEKKLIALMNQLTSDRFSEKK
jgi:hypothetical protein